MSPTTSTTQNLDGDGPFRVTMPLRADALLLSCLGSETSEFAAQPAYEVFGV